MLTLELDIPRTRRPVSPPPQDVASFGSWLSVVTREGRAGRRLTLRAPSRFHAAYVQTHLSGRILAACRAVDEDVSDIIVIA